MSDSPLTETPNGVTIAVWVVPGSSRTVIDGRHGNHIKVRVTSPPERGQANEEVARLLGEALDAEVTLKAGIRRRSKLFQVSQNDAETVGRKLGL